jgi:mRNA-degrading endonuclease toxin of MazEF toxin-antitoxin module
VNVQRSFSTKVNQFPRLRDVWMFDFSPTRGTETPDEHPGIIMSELAFNKHGLCVVVAISHSLLGNPLAITVPIDPKLGYEGFIHPDRIRTLSFKDRVVGSARLGVLPDELYEELLSRLATLLDPEQRIFRQT